MKQLLAIVLCAIGGYTNATSITEELIAADETSATYSLRVQGQPAGQMRVFADGTTATRIAGGYWGEQIQHLRTGRGKKWEGPQSPVEGMSTVTEAILYWYDPWENTTRTVGTNRISTYRVPR